MCGIAGEIALGSACQGVCRRRVERMSEQIARRGPEASGLWCDDNGAQARVMLAHRRLSIVDLSDRGAQPMRDESSDLTLVFNGIIYNWRALRGQLERLGHRFFSQSDTEVLLRGWKEWGAQALERLDGVFAFAVWDGRERRLYLARDRLGIKPLYFHHDGGHFRFCSNIQGLLASGRVGVALDTQALAVHFSLHGVVPAPRTVLREVRKLAPGHFLRLDSLGNISTQRWWRLRAGAPAATAREWRARAQDLLVEAVRKRFDTSDTPVGVLLSGGLDSSLIVAVLSHLGRSIKTYSIGFDDDSNEPGSEFYYSDQVVARYQTEHHKWVVPNRRLLDRLPEVVSCMSEPMPAQDCAGFYLLAEQVSSDVKLVLSGQGADEVFAGYFWYPQMRAGAGSDWDRFSGHYLDCTADEYRALVEESRYAEPDCQSIFDAAMRQAASECGDDFVNRLLYFDATTLVTDDPVKRVDNMCLSHGLEARVPFLDADLLSGVCAMPSKYKLASGGKGVLRDLARQWLPDEVIDRRKGYFPVPALKYMRGPFLEMARDVLSSSACRDRGLYRREATEALAARPNAESSYTPLRGNRLWHCALLEIWLQKMDALASQASAG